MRTVALNKSHDFLIGLDDGYSTFALCGGADAIIQGVIVGLEISRGDIWYDVSYGVDKHAIFYNAKGTDDEMAGIRATAYREFLKTFNGVELTGDDFEFIRADRRLSVKIPCIRISCAQQIQTFEIGKVNGC